MRILASAAIVLAAAAACADTLDERFATFDAAEWEAVNCKAEVLPDGGGLRLRIEPGTTSAGIRSKRWWEDMFDIRVEYEVVGAVDETHVILRLTNDEMKRHVDVLNNMKFFKGRKPTEWYSYSSLQNYHDGKMVGNRGTGIDGVSPALRLAKDAALEVFGFQARPGGGWNGPFDYPWVPMNFDCPRYQAGVFITLPKQTKPVDLVVKRFRAWGSLYRAADRKETEAHYPRASDEPEKDPKLWRFDFGPPGQQLERLHLPVTQYTMYDSRRGWGWVTDLEPVWNFGKLPGLSNEEAVKVGLEPTLNGGWRRGSDMLKNRLMADRKRCMGSINHGGDYVQFFGKWMDLKIPCERDMVFAKRPYGFPLNRQKEADQWERRAATYVDDDLEATFTVDLPNDRYTLLVGVGYTEGGPNGGDSPFTMEAEGFEVKKSLSNNWRRCQMFQADDVEVRDGQLNLSIRANRRLAMNRIDAWDLGVSWMINYLCIIPSDDREAIKAEQWRLINDRGRKVRQVTFVEGEPMGARVEANHLVVDEKPMLPILWQAFHGDTQMHYPYYLWGNTMATIGVGWHFKGSGHFMEADWVRLSAADDYPWREINTLNLAHRWGSNTLLRVSGFLNFMPRAVAGEGGTLQDSRGRADRWNVQPPLNSRLEREIQKEAYTMASQQLKLHPDIMGHYMYEEFWHPKNVGYDHQSVNQFHLWLAEKYKTIGALNDEWGTRYGEFSEIQPPPQPEESACWANFRRFRMYAQEQTIAYPRGLLHELEPNRVTFGAKGDYATASWYYANEIELFGWYSANTARGAAYHFGQVPMVGGEMFGCPWGWDDGRK
ncbi:MAG TPA: beta-galactosidase, partial [Planctomycetota bacterium]|nr:beta-galactosidase [Planctomycetota bacterium]